MIKIEINQKFHLVKKWHIFKKQLLLKVTSMRNVRVPWCPTSPLIILTPFDALPSCDTGSYFAPGDLEPFQKKKKNTENWYTPL